MYQGQDALCCLTYGALWNDEQETRCGEVACHFPDALNGSGLCGAHMVHLERELDSEKTVGWHDWRPRWAADGSHVLACDVEIGNIDTAPQNGVATIRTLRCGEPGTVLFIDESGFVHRRCPGHIPDVGDGALQQSLLPRTEYQVGRWETIYYVTTHPLTNTRAFFVNGDAEAVQRATALLAFLSAVRDQRPADMPDDAVQPGWMGSEEDEARLSAAGEQTYFPYIPESLREEFGGATTIYECFDNIHREVAGGDNLDADASSGAAGRS